MKILIISRWIDKKIIDYRLNLYFITLVLQINSLDRKKGENPKRYINFRIVRNNEYIFSRTLYRDKNYYK